MSLHDELESMIGMVSGGKSLRLEEDLRGLENWCFKEKLGKLYRPVPGRSWLLVGVGPCKLGPTSSRGQRFAVGTPRVSRRGQTSIIRICWPWTSKSNSRVGSQEVDPRPLTSYQLWRSLGHEGPCMWCGWHVQE